MQRCRMDAISSPCGGFAILILVCGLLGACTSLPDTSGYDGCISWLELDAPVGTESLLPVLPDGCTADR